MEFHPPGAGAQRDDAVGGKLREAMLDAFADLQRRQPAGDGFRLCEPLCRGEQETAALARLRAVPALHGRRSAFDFRPFFRAKEV